MRTPRYLSLILGLLLAAMTAAPASAEPSAAERATQELAAYARSLPADLPQRAAAKLGDPAGTDLLNPECRPTRMRSWVQERTKDLTPQDQDLLQRLAILQLARLDVVAYGRAGDPAYVITRHREVTTRTFRTATRFWDVRGDDITLLGMRSLLGDVQRVERVYRELLGLSPSQAQTAAGLIVQYVRQPKFENGNHPMFTLNAFAYSAFGKPIAPGQPPASDRLVVGDGLLRIFDEIGIGDIAPQAVVGHEYGHHVQYEIGMKDGEPATTPQQSRRYELHADATSGYFLSHRRGMAYRGKKVNEFLPVLAELGDCDITSPSHHGTPAQRERATRWGYFTQATGWPPAKVLPAKGFQQRFDLALPLIVGLG